MRDFTDELSAPSTHGCTLTHVAREQAGLLLASNAALVTTDPPEAGILNYTIRGPYVCLWTSFGILLGGIIIAATDVYALATCYPEWVVQVRPCATEYYAWGIRR